MEQQTKLLKGIFLILLSIALLQFPFDATVIIGIVVLILGGCFGLSTFGVFQPVENRDTEGTPDQQEAQNRQDEDHE